MLFLIAICAVAGAAAPAHAATTSTDANGNVLTGVISHPLIVPTQDSQGNVLSGLAAGPFSVHGEDSAGNRVVPGVVDPAFFFDTIGGEGEGEGVVEGAIEGEGEGVVEGTVEGAVEGEGEGTACEGARHSADVSGDNRIQLQELLRVIQFFNSSRFGCGAGTDGFAPNSTVESCCPHDSDFNTQNWRISLPELLRLIQFFNSGGYNRCAAAGTLDGFCPGQAP